MGDNTINMNNYKFNKDLKGSNTLYIIIAVFAIILLLQKSLVIVDVGTRTIVFTPILGKTRSISEGLHFIVPFLEYPIQKYDVREQTYTMGAVSDERVVGDQGIVALTSDGQKIMMDMSLIYRLDPATIATMHQEIGPQYLDKIVRPQIRSITRNIVAEYPVEKVYSEERNEIQDKIYDRAQKELNKYFILVSKVLIRKITFSPEFAKAVEQKQVALQEAQRMKYVNQKEELEKERKIIEASGISKAYEIEGQTLRKYPELIQMKYVNKLSPGVKTIISDQASIINFPADLLKEGKK